METVPHTLALSKTLEASIVDRGGGSQCAVEKLDGDVNAWSFQSPHAIAFLGRTILPCGHAVRVVDTVKRGVPFQNPYRPEPHGRFISLI